MCGESMASSLVYMVPVCFWGMLDSVTLAFLLNELRFTVLITNNNNNNGPQ